MALTARELVFYIRAENQASGVFRRVAADLRSLPSRRVIEIQEKYNSSTQQLLASNQKYLKGVNEQLSAKSKSIELSRVELDAQIQQNTALSAYNRIQQQVAVNQANITRAQVESQRLGRVVATGGNLRGYTADETAGLSAAADARVANLIQQQKILGDAADQTTLKIKAQGLALDEETAAAKVARINGIAAAFSRVASAVRIAGIASLASIAVLAHSAASFETQTTLAATQARPPGATAAATQTISLKLNDQILKQMKQFPATSKQMADSLYQIFSGTNIQSVSKASQFMKIFNEEAVAGGTDLGTMTDAMITVTNNFDKGNYSVKTLTANANLFFSAVRYGRMTAQQFASALSYIVPIAKDVGSTFSNVAQDMAFFTRQTGGTLTRNDAQGYARLIQLLGRTDVAAGLATKGIQVFNQQTGKMNSIVSIIGQIHDKLKLNPQETLNFFKTISQAGGGLGTQGTIQAIRIFSQGINNVKNYQTVVKEVTTDQNEFLRSYQAMSKTPAIQFQVAINALKAIGIELGRDAIPAIILVGHYLVLMFQWFDGLSDHTKKLVAEFLVFGGTAAILAGTIVKLAAAGTTLLTFLGILDGEKGFLGVAGAAGSLNVGMGLLLGTFGLLAYLIFKFPNQTNAVIQALGGLKTVITAVGLALTGAGIGIFASTTLPELSVGIKAATASLALFTDAEGIALVATVSLDAAMAFLLSPVAIGAGLALIVGGIIYLATRASATTKAINDLKKAIDSTAASRLQTPQLKLNLNEAQNQLAEAKTALNRTTTGTLAWKEAVDQVKSAMIDVKSAQDAVKKNQQDINNQLHDQLVSILKVKTATAGNVQKNDFSVDMLPVSEQGAIRMQDAAKATQDFVKQIDNLAEAEQKSNPLYARNLFLIEQMTQAIGHVPSQKVLKMILDNKSLDKQLKDYINQMPAEYKDELLAAGTIMGQNQGQAWLAAMNAELAQFDPDVFMFPGGNLLKNTNGKGPTATQGRYPNNPIGMVPSQYDIAQAAATAKAKKLATDNAAYMKQLQHVSALDAAYTKSGSLADEQAFYNAKTALDKKYGDSYDAYTSDYLSKAEDTTKKANKAAETAAQKHMKTMQQIWTQSATQLQSQYAGAFGQNQSAFGSIFSGPFVNSPHMQDEITYGHKLTGQDLVNDLKSQIKQFKDWRDTLTQLQKKGIPYELLQQIEAAGPAALPEVKALLSLKPATLQSYFSMFKNAEVGPNSLLSKATGTDLTRQLKFYKSFGQSAALAILQGLQSADTPILSYFEDLIKKMFPQLAAAAKHPAAKTSGGLNKTPGKVSGPKIPKAKTHTGHPGESGRSTGGKTLGVNSAPAVVSTEQHDHWYFGSDVDKITQTEIKKAVRKATFTKRSRNL